MKRSNPSSSTARFVKEAKMKIEDDSEEFKFESKPELLERLPKEERPSPSDVYDKIIKEEIPDEEEYNSSALMFTDYNLEEFLEHSLEEEIPEDEEYNSSAFMVTDNKLDDFSERTVKEEIPDDSYEWKTVKSEQDPFIKKETEPEPSESTSGEKSALIWRPNITSLSDFTLFDDLDDSQLDLGLGSSILFDKGQPERYLEVPEEKRYRSVTPINFDDEYDPNFRETYESLMPKKQMPSFKIKQILKDSFEKNRHPNAIDYIKISEMCGVRYRTVFDDFENRRKAAKEICMENDACKRIRTFFLRDGENMCYNRVKDSIRRVLEDEIETHLLSRKRFSIGYVHVIMEKTNLPPAYIRGQYESYKKKMLTKGRDEYKYNNGNRDDCEDPNSLPIDILRKLEEAYLTKKYQCEEKEWSPKDYKALAAQLTIGEKTVTAWLEKRRDAVLGLNHDIVEMRKEKLARMKMADGRKLPSQITESLNAEYERNDRPSVTRRVIIAKKLNLTEMQVRNFFNKKRIRTRRHAEWEAARQDVIKMPREKVQLMEKIAAEKRKSADDYMADAKKIGVAYMTLISFVNWRKSVVASKLSNFKYQSSANHKY